jgi:hypothetical protein
MKELGETLYKKWVSPNHFPYNYNKAAGQGEALARVGVRGLAPLPRERPDFDRLGEAFMASPLDGCRFSGGAGGPVRSAADRSPRSVYP